MRHAWSLCLFLGIFVGSAHGEAAPVLLFPGVAHSAVSRSSMVLNNPAATQQSILLELLTPGSAVASAGRAVLLAAGERREIADLYAFLGAADGVGMLRVTGPAKAKVRFRREDDDAGWQELSAVDSERPIAPNEEVDFPYSAPAELGRDARSNLILVNLDSRDVTVTISEGLTTARKAIPAGAFVEIDNLGTLLGTPAGIATAHAVADGRWSGSLMTARTLAVGQRRRAVAPPGLLPSSFGLIDKALAAGTINAEQALTYKVFSDFGDPRLPAAFRGDDSEVTEADSPALAAEQWATLSQATQDLIGPYLIPAFYEGSWWYLRRAAAKSVRPLELGCKAFDTIALCKIGTEWKYVEGKHVRVWYETSEPDDIPVANDLIKATDETIWAELIKVMGREPIVVDEINGTKLLDVVLTDNLDPGVLATTFPLGAGCLYGPTYVAVLRNQGNVRDRNSAFAHELFHSVQHTYNTNGGRLVGCLERNYKWLMESTATWFEDELYPGVNREQFFANKYLDHTDLSIDTTVGLDSTGITGHRYGAYVFFFYLTRIAGANPYTLVRNIWEATESRDAIHALETGLSQSAFPLDEAWPGFAVYSWNREAPYNLYQTISSAGAPQGKEGLTAKSQILDSFDIVGEIRHELGNRGDELPHLSIRYYRVNFGGDTTSSVAFYNGIQRALDTKAVDWVTNFGPVLTAKPVSDPASIKGAHVDMLLKIRGSDLWRHEDLTDKPFKTYCRDLTKERIESLVIILSNSDIENTLKPQGAYAPIVQATNIGCYRWEGTADLTNDDGYGRIEKMTVSDLRLEAQGDVPEDEDTPLRRLFSAVGGTFTWSISGTSGGCVWQAAPVVNESLARADTFIYTFPYAMSPGVGGTAAARGILPYLVANWLQQRLIVTQSGTDCLPGLVAWNAFSFYMGPFSPDDPIAKIESDGRSYKLDAVELGDEHVTGKWTFTAKSQ